MSGQKNVAQYDEILTSILVNEKSILGFLSSIFNFLARRTDFYYVPKSPNEDMGFPPGVAEELVIKVLRSCDPKNIGKQNASKLEDINDEIMCSTVANEVEVVAENEVMVDDKAEETTITDKTNKNIYPPEDYAPPKIPVQQNSEAYNGAIREKYTWSQSITELDVIVKLPPNVTSAKDVKVTINPMDIYVACKNGEEIIKDSFPYKIKATDSFWSISEGRMLIHLEKFQERWWNKLLTKEEEIDLSKIDASRPLDDLPEDHIAKVHELQWNQEQKLKGLPTSDQIRNMDVLRRAWNAEGSPFKGKEFDPSLLHMQ